MNGKLLVCALIAELLCATFATTLPVLGDPTASSLGVSDALGATGALVSVPVTIANIQNGPIICVRFDICYNTSAITVTDVRRGDLTTTWDSPTFNNFAWGTSVMIVQNGADELHNGTTGSVVSLDFAVLGSPGSESEMNLQNIQLADAAYNVGSAPPQNGTFSIIDEQSPVMELTADPLCLGLNGDTSLITATICTNSPCSDPIPHLKIHFNTSLGTIANLSSPGSGFAATECWVETNESGVALAVLTSGTAYGIARVCAWADVGTTVVNTVDVAFERPDYGVTVDVDAQTKQANSNENITYSLEVMNIGLETDTYTVSITETETDFAELTHEELVLSPGASAVVALTTRSSLAGNYTTTVAVSGTNVTASVTVRAIIAPFYGCHLQLFPEKSQTIAPGWDACYRVTITNTGNIPDRYAVTIECPAAVQAALSTNFTTLLGSNESEEILLTLTSVSVGEHIITFTATPEGNPNAATSVTTKLAVSRKAFELDTGSGTYPSMAGVHRGTIRPNHTVVVSRFYTYPMEGTGGHAQFVEFSNISSGWCINATWAGYKGDYHNLTFPERFILSEGALYQYTIITGSYPRLITEASRTLQDGTVITCSSFVAMNGEEYDARIPAFCMGP